MAVLNKNGFEAFCVGGAVRDMLIGITPHDFDIATACLPQTVETLFPHTIPTGIKHGTVTVLFDGEPVEITTYRVDGDYADSRHPDSVQFIGNIKDDLARRDFTVNAIAFNETVGIFDPFCGAQDIKSRIIRAVGDPALRFKEDALRIMRAFRFASQLGFSIENKTKSAALELAGTLESVSAERIFSELSRLLCGKNVASAGELFSLGGLSFCGIEKCDISPIGRLPRNLPVRFSALCLLCGGDPQKICRFLKSDNALRTQSEKICKLYRKGTGKTAAELKSDLRIFGEEAVRDCISLETVILKMSGEEKLSELDRILESEEPYLIKHLAVNGRDLEKKGISGSETGQVLERMLSAVTADPSLNTKNYLLSHITK